MERRFVIEEQGGRIEGFLYMREDTESAWRFMAARIGSDVSSVFTQLKRIRVSPIFATRP